MVGATPDVRPEDGEPEPAIPDLGRRAVTLAAQWVESGRRLDMQLLAAALGVSRVTLFRHAGSREALLGESLWVLADRTMAAAQRRFDASSLNGSPNGARSAGVLQLFNDLVASAPGLRRLLDKEPALALRVLTDPRGVVQPRAVAAVEALLRRDQEESGLELPADPYALSFALVRLAESFLYADVLASRTPDVDVANRLQRSLIENPG